MSETPKKLSQYANQRPTTQSLRLDAVEGIPLTITKAAIVKGDFGNYVDFTSQDDKGIIYQVRTYNRQVLAAFEQVLDSDDFPVTAKFTNVNGRWQIE